MHSFFLVVGHEGLTLEGSSRGKGEGKKKEENFRDGKALWMDVSGESRCCRIECGEQGCLVSGNRESAVSWFETQLDELAPGVSRHRLTGYRDLILLTYLG